MGSRHFILVVMERNFVGHSSNIFRGMLIKKSRAETDSPESAGEKSRDGISFSKPNTLR